MSTNNYKAAFEALSLDLCAIIALLGFNSYTGVDPVLRRITDLLVSVPEYPGPRGVTSTSHPALIALDKQCRDDVARAMGLTPTAERDFAWSYLLDRLKRLVGDAATAGSDGGVDELLADALRKIMAAHRFNVASMPVTEVHSVCFDALAARSPNHAALKAQPSGGDERAAVYMLKVRGMSWWRDADKAAFDSAPDERYEKLALYTRAAPPPNHSEREVVLEGSVPSIKCWSCKLIVSLDDRADADGSCPHCSVELDLEEYLRAMLAAGAGLQGATE